MRSALARFRRWVLRVHRDLEIGDHVLQYLFMEITRGCDLACLHCGSDCGNGDRSGELDASSWLSVIDYAKARFDPFFVITGGEPLVSPDMDAIAGRLGELGARWVVVTMGYALDSAAIRRLASQGPSRLTVSVDGLRESHNALRGCIDRHRRREPPGLP